MKKLTNQEFIARSTVKHGNRYDYSFAEYAGTKVKVKIFCPIHGIFMQIPEDHWSGLGCAKCGRVANLSNEEFIKRALELHGDVYNYSSVSYYNMHSKVSIICSKHGVFLQTPANHLKLAGCPTCKRSKGEKIISWFLRKHSIEYVPQKTFDDCRKKGLLPFDFFIPTLNLCIEYHGIQHYESVEHMNGEKGFNERKENDALKVAYCNRRGIGLVVLKYNQKAVPVLEKEVLQKISANI